MLGASSQIGTDDTTKDEVTKLDTVTDTKTMTDDDIKDINLDVDDKPDTASDFTKDKPVPNIWTFDAEHKDEDEDKFDKPSFLRRLTRRGKKHDDDNKDDDSDSKSDKKDDDKTSEDNSK